MKITLDSQIVERLGREFGKIEPLFLVDGIPKGFGNNVS